jgi:Na+-driven multidrug efflux pump
MSSGYFQAVGKPKQAMILTLARQVIILIPAILILPGIYGLDGILVAGPLSDIVSALLCGALLFYELKSMRKIMDSDILPVQDENIIPLNVI